MKLTCVRSGIESWDCTYIWGPDNQFYTRDKMDSSHIAWRFDPNSACSFDEATYDITCP